MRCEVRTDWRPALSQLVLMGLMEMMRWVLPVTVATAAAMTATISGAISAGASGWGPADFDGAAIMTGAVAALGSGTKICTSLAVKAQRPQRIVKVPRTMAIPAR